VLLHAKLGLITVCFGSTLWWILPDSPHTAKFLTERERIIAVERLKSNKTGVKNAHHKQYQVIEALKDFKVWMLVAAIFFHNMTNFLQTNVSLTPPSSIWRCISNNNGNNSSLDW
jgi:ACS family allantoate permease-like MFS transporter